MKWFPPRIEHCRSISGCYSVLFLALAGLNSGCTTLPAMRSLSATTASSTLPADVSLAAQIPQSAKPRVAPDFDLLPSPVKAVPVQAAPAVAVVGIPAVTPLYVGSPNVGSPQVGSPQVGSIVAPKPADVSVKRDNPTAPIAAVEKAAEITASKAAVAAVENPKTEISKAAAAVPANPAQQVAKPAVPTVAVPAKVAMREPEGPDAPKIELPRTDVAQAAAPQSGASQSGANQSGANQSKSNAAKATEAKPKGVLVNPPKPFGWERDGKSTGGRSFLTVSAGHDGYRTLVVGSVGGNDPAALELVEMLARRLHDDSVILGGFECTVLRTLNPDGEANHKYLNQNGQYVNDFFPKSGEKLSADQPVEVAYLLKQLKERQPQRVVHVRTVKGANGLIASSESCLPAAKEAAEWVKFRLVKLPENGRSSSTMERYISTTGSSDMLTFAFPETTPRTELWDRYGDTLLNLLLGEDNATRELARKQSQQSSADRRNQSP